MYITIKKYFGFIYLCFVYCSLLHGWLFVYVVLYVYNIVFLFKSNFLL